MTTRREFLTRAFSSSVVLLAAACGPSATQPAPTSAPGAAPTSAPAAKPTTPPAAGAATSAPQPTAAAKTTAPANISGANVSLLQWNHFIPTADPFFKQQAEDWGKQTSVNITVETINANDLVPRFTAAIQGQSGPTVFQMQYLAPHSFAEGLYDLTDLAKETESKFGNFYDQVNTSAMVEGKYRGVPYAIFGNAVVYRKDYFQQAGAKVPESWDDFHDAVKKLAAINKPIGQTFAQTFGDAPTFFYPLMWSYGGKEVQDDGKTIAINSKETEAAIEYVRSLYNDAMDPAVLSWDNASNNQWLNSGKGSWIHNPISHYVVAKEKKLPVAELTGFHPSPAGPAGRHTVGVPRGLGIWKFSKNIDAAKDFLKWFFEPAQYHEWIMSGDNYNHPIWRDMENHPVWDVDPKYRPLKTIAQYSHLYGWPAPGDERIQVITNSYIIPNMFAKVVTSALSPKDAMLWAETEIKRVFATR